MFKRGDKIKFLKNKIKDVPRENVFLGSLEIKIAQGLTTEDDYLDYEQKRDMDWHLERTDHWINNLGPLKTWGNMEIVNGKNYLVISTDFHGPGQECIYIEENYLELIPDTLCVGMKVEFLKDEYISDFEKNWNNDAEEVKAQAEFIYKATMEKNMYITEFTCKGARREATIETKTKGIIIKDTNIRYFKEK